MIVRFRKYIKENKLFDPSDKIVLSVSGGIDSMVMLFLFNKMGVNIAVAHCNFGLRGDDSNKDETLVQEYAEGMKVPFYVKRFNTRQFATENKMSIQMAARKLRIDWCESLLVELKFNYYATAHHLNDQTETFFINLFRGTGLSGIHGILPKRENLLHPMMFAWKNEIIRFARIKRIPYRLDKSNLTTDYERNAFRHKVIPVLKEINAGFEKTLSESISHFRQAEILYQQRIEEGLKSIVHADKSQLMVNIAKLLQLDQSLTYLFELLSKLNFNRKTISNIHDELKSQSGKQFQSPSHQLIIDRNFIIIRERTNKNLPDVIEINIENGEVREPVHLVFQQLNASPEISCKQGSDISMFDYDKLEFPLRIRKWRKGDYFYPLGMGNRKLLSDFFIDKKLSLFDKERVWLLLSGSDIIWVIGHRIDDRYKITSQTQKILKIELTETES